MRIDAGYPPLESVQAMAADLILYCLERLTDHQDFERLASDVMVGVGHANLEPIGGSSDGGRDARSRR